MIPCTEDAETFTVTLGDITSTLSSWVFLDSEASSAQATIAESDVQNPGESPTPPEDDPAPPETPSDPTPPSTPAGITLSVNPTSVGEDAGATSFTVTATLDGGETFTSDTIVTTSLGGSATENTDYTVTTALASITIPANSTSGNGTLSINPTDDGIVEGPETIRISGSTTIGLEVSSAQIRLLGNPPWQQLDPALLSISGPTRVVPEGSAATFTVTLSAAISRAVTVAWSVVLPENSATAADLETTSGSVTFPAGSAAGATRTIRFTVTDDALSETSESFTVSLGTITFGTSRRGVGTSRRGVRSLSVFTLPRPVSLKDGASSATATIAESDRITVHLTGPSSVNEGDATSSYTVTLSPAGVIPTADLTVEYTTADGTAKAGSDFTAISGVLTFTQSNAGAKSLFVQTTDDALDEGNGETFSVSILNPAGGGGPPPLLASTVVTTINDDDQAEDAPPSPPENDPVPPRPTPDTPSRPTPDQPTHTPTNTYTPGTWSSSTGGTSSPVTAEASNATTVEASTGMAGTSSTSTVEAPTTSTMETTSVPTPGDSTTSASGNGVTSNPESGVATTSGVESMPTSTSVDDAPPMAEDDIPPTPEAPGGIEAEDDNPLSWLTPFPWWLLLLILALMLVLIIATRRLVKRVLGQRIRGA